MPARGSVLSGRDGVGGACWRLPTPSWCVPTGALLACGIAGPILFVAVILIDGATRPGYDPIRHYVSLLSLGDRGWVEVASFIASGILIGASGLGLRRAWRPRPGGVWAAWLVVVVGLAFVWSALFSADPAQGYPPGTPGPPPGTLGWLPSNPTWHALLHFLGSIVVTTGLAAAGLLAARADTSRHSLLARAWRASSVAIAAIILGAWLFGFLSDTNGAPPSGGLLQRISIAAGMQWLVVTAATELRRVRAAPRELPADRAPARSRLARREASQPAS